MNDDKKFVDYQEETIYVCKQIEDEEKTKRTIAKFFSELVKRRRDDPNNILEDGLQAAIVILPDKTAMKICEMDGTAAHNLTFINLTKHLNDDHRYISVTGGRYPRLYQNEKNQLNKSGIEIRISDTKKELRLYILPSASIEVNQYHIEMLKILLLFCKYLKDNQIYNRVIIGIDIPGYQNEAKDLSDDHYRDILNGLEKCIEDKNLKL